MFLTELFEQQTTKHAAFCFGRMNPPTVGHAQLINTVAKASQGGDYFVFVSQTQDAKKNPLSYETKVKFIKALFPEQASHIVYAPELKTIMQVANWLYSKGYRSVTFAAGGDRLDSFKKLLTDYNGQEDGYNFDSINFVSSGDRDPDADGIAGVSASSAREAAKAGNLEAFAQATGAGKLAKPLYNAVRKGMLLEGTFTDSEVRYMPGRGRGKQGSSEYIWSIEGKGGPRVIDPTGKVIYTSKNTNAYQAREEVKAKAAELNNGLAECSGYIPKNKKEAKDPRWSNALTVDVHPDTPTKNMKALGLI
jgi:hypothetical protein